MVGLRSRCRTAQFVLIAVGDAGYVSRSPTDFATSDKLILEPWGRLEGEVMAGGRPKANEEISFSPNRRQGGLPHGVFLYQYDTKTDDHGHYSFDRVIPGHGLVTRALVTNYGRFSQRLGLRRGDCGYPPGAHDQGAHWRHGTVGHRPGCP